MMSYYVIVNANFSSEYDSNPLWSACLRLSGVVLKTFIWGSLLRIDLTAE
jgi:hypothetical protein